MDDDPYAFCYEIEGQLTKALGKAELAVFERLIRARFDATPEEKRYERGRWGGILRAIYAAQPNAAAYQAFAEETGLDPKDCLALATMSVSQEPGVTLEWVERGLDLERATPHGTAAAYNLNRLHRELLTTLGRGDEALKAAWIDFQKHPSKYSFEELMEFVPEAQRASWREKALDAAAQGTDLHSLLDLFVETGEAVRLADLVRRTSDAACRRRAIMRPSPRP
jgi:hypothetical protein